MTREFNPEGLIHSLALRKRLLSLIDSFQLDPKQLDRTAAALEQIALDYQTFSKGLRNIDEAEISANLADAIRIAAHLVRWADHILKASSEAHLFYEAANAQGAILKERISSQGSLAGGTTNALREWTQNMIAIERPLQTSEMLFTLASIQLPIFFSYNSKPQGVREYFERHHKESVHRNTAIVAKLTFALDGQILTTPQAIKSRVHHDLAIELVVAKWPTEYDSLEIDYISTMAPDSYYLTPFSVPRSLGKQQQLSGHCIFHYAQSLLSDPAVVKVRARFVSVNGSNLPDIKIVGHSELRLRILDQESHPVLTNYPIVDIQIPKILEQIQRELPDLPRRDFDDFTRCLIYLSRYAGVVLQSGTFKGKKVNETRDFQSHLLHHLRNTELGSEVREGERTSGGILDLRYNNIVIELKVETSITDREELRRAYLEQTTHYTTHSLPISIVCILDMTDKRHPPANIGNNITLEEPVVHGFENTTPQYPSKVAVIVIDGNTKSPSDYS